MSGGFGGRTLAQFWIERGGNVSCRGTEFFGSVVERFVIGG